MKKNQQVPSRRSGVILGIKAVSSGVNMECNVCSFTNHPLLWGWTKVWHIRCLGRKQHWPSAFRAREKPQPKEWKERFLTDAGTIPLTPLASETLLSPMWSPRVEQGWCSRDGLARWRGREGIPRELSLAVCPDLDSWARGGGGHSLSLGHHHLLWMTSATPTLMVFSLNPWLSEPQSKKQN